MKNLIKAVTNEQKKRLEDFIFEINQVQEVSVLNQKYSYYYDLIPRGKDISGYSLDQLRSYLIERKQKAVYKSIEREVNRINTVAKAGELREVKISIEWKKSQMWGSNPNAEAWCSFTNESGNYDSHYVKSGSIVGCGYDKQSTAVAECLNQFNEVLKLLYTAKAKHPNAKNNELLGYGSGYGILPSIEGGVGVSCYPLIFEPLGYKFETVASGKTYDVYTITKKQKA